MSDARFVHLTVRTAYSLAEGAIRIRNLGELCRRHAMPAVAVTDGGNLFGALEFALTVAEGGVQPIVGVNVGIRSPDQQGSTASREADRLVLLVMDQTGYRNLLDLVSRTYLEQQKSAEPALELSDLEGRTDGLIALTGGVSGPVGRLLLDGRRHEAGSMLDRLQRLFEGRLYIELQRHGLEAEEQIEPCLVDMAYDRDLPLVATNDCHFATAEEFEAHQVLMCIAAATTISDPRRPRLTADHHFKSALDMQSLFQDLPEAVANTVEIARRCSFIPDERDPILPDFVKSEAYDERADLRQKALDGLEMRLRKTVYPHDAEPAQCSAIAVPYSDRLEMELDVIINMGFAGYFLIVSDFIRWAREQGIPVGPGRGSGAGSVVAWSLQITDLDPLKWGLLFERFLNPERVSMPDFDIDFCQDRRGEVLEYVQEKYGHDRVAQIITFGSLQARGVIRDVGRVLEMPYSQTDRISKLIPQDPANPVSLSQAIETVDQLREERDADAAVAGMLEIALRLEGLYRNASTHAAGVVIGDRPLTELVPLYRDPRSGMPATQFSMKWVEKAGLVKFDFLGLKTLSVLRKAVDLLARRDIHIDLETLPLDDERSYRMIQRGDTRGVFQLESSGMRDVLRRMRPDRFEDIIALVALFRPGPMANIPSYIARKHGLEPVDYFDARLQPVLEETFGIFIYQEQVQQAAQLLAGYTLGGADLLRRAMGKKIKAEMDAQQETFVNGSVERGMAADKAASIFDTISAFAGYGFNKSHAAAYALVAYQTAYMKANYPVEFFAASMSYERRDTDKLYGFRQEMMRLGCRLLPPDINRSASDFTVEACEDGTLAVRYALSAIRNVGDQAMISLVQDREANGPYQSLPDLAARIDSRSVGRRMLEALIRSGALDCLSRNRAQLIEGIEVILRHAAQAQEERNSSQARLFDDDHDAQVVSLALPDCPDWDPMQSLQQECDAIGFYLSAHPLDTYDPALEQLDVVASSDINEPVEAADGSTTITLAGVVTGRRIRTNQRGNRYAFVQLSDRTGGFEVSVFSDVLDRVQDLLEHGKPVLVRAEARAQDGTIRLVANSIRSLDEVVDEDIGGLRIFLRDSGFAPKLATILSKHCQGRSRVRVVCLTRCGEVEMGLPSTYGINIRTWDAIRSLPGIVEVQKY